MRPGKKKYGFKFVIGNVIVCRDAFCVALGLPFNSNRIMRLQTRVNNGEKTLSWQLTKVRALKGNGLQQECTAFLQNVALNQSEKSPVRPVLYILHQRIKNLFRLYKVKYSCRPKTVEQSTLEKLWKQVFKTKLVDPDTGILCAVEKKKIYAAGHKTCDICEELALAIRQAKSKAEKADARANDNEHRDAMRADQQTVNRLMDRCIGSDTDFGCTLDCPDFNKFPTPSVRSKAPIMSDIMKIKNKITAVVMWNKPKTVHLYRCLPDIRTGANLTLTVLMRLLDQGHLDKCVNFYLYYDGASDNINYTFIKACCHILVCAEKMGWPLRSIFAGRKKTGHTKNDADREFAAMSMYFYGSGSRGDGRADVLDWEQFRQALEEIFEGRLGCFEEIKGTYDWDSFVSDYRPTTAESGLMKIFAVQMTVQDGIVCARSKAHLRDECRWSKAMQIFPHPSSPHTKPHDPKKVPDISPLKEWVYRDLIVQDLTKFYTNELPRVVVAIPEAVKNREYVLYYSVLC